MDVKFSLSDFWINLTKLPYKKTSPTLILL